MCPSGGVLPVGEISESRAGLDAHQGRVGETAGCGSSGQREVAGMSLHEVSWERVTLSWGSHAKLDSRGS